MASVSSRPWILCTAAAIALAFPGLAGLSVSQAEEGAAAPAAPASIFKALPQDSSVVVRIRPAALLSSPAIKSLDIPGFLKAQGKDGEIPFPIEQISEVVFGGPAERDPTVLITLASPLSEADFAAKAKAEKRDEPVEGKTVYTVKGTEFAFLSPTELVATERPADLKKALAAVAGSGEPCALAAEMAKLDAPFALVMKDLPIPEDPEKGKIVRASLTAKVGDSIALSAEAELEKPELAAATAAMVKAQIGEVQKQACQQLQQILELPAPPAIAAFDSLKISAEGKTVKAQAEITAADLALAKKAMEKIAEQMKAMQESLKGMQPPE